MPEGLAKRRPPPNNHPAAPFGSGPLNQKHNCMNFVPWIDDTPLKTVQQIVDDRVAQHVAAGKFCTEKFKGMAKGKHNREVRVRRSQRVQTLEQMPMRWWHESVNETQRQIFNAKIRMAPQHRSELLAMKKS